MILKTPLTEATQDFEGCNREKIQFIGEIQSYGKFYAVNNTDLKIVMASENTANASEQAIGRRFHDLEGNELGHEIDVRLRSGILITSSHHAFAWRGQRPYDVFLFKLSENLIAIELSPQPETKPLSDAQFTPVEERIRSFVQCIKDADAVDEIGRIACQAVRSLTGLDRVMLYRFSQITWHGEVIAEDRTAVSQSFLNHKFPASDIPEPARNLYLRNQVRLIYDVDDKTSSIFPQLDPGTKATIDLSDSRLRAVSKIHLQYLKNMGVKTSFSVAVTVEGKLWGLFAGHGTKAIYISHNTRSVCETLAQAVGLAAPLLEQTRLGKYKLEFNSSLYEIHKKLLNSTHPIHDLLKDAGPITHLFKANGVAYVTAKVTELAGVTPKIADVQKLRGLVLEKMQDEKTNCVALESFNETFPELKFPPLLISGALCVSIPYFDQALLILFRPEYIRSVQWGGDPRKNLQSRNYEGQINPRASFESWSETIQNRSLPWTDYEIQGLELLKQLVFDGLARKSQLISELSSTLKAKSNVLP